MGVAGAQLITAGQLPSVSSRPNERREHLDLELEYEGLQLSSTYSVEEALQMTAKMSRRTPPTTKDAVASTSPGEPDYEGHLRDLQAALARIQRASPQGGMDVGSALGVSTGTEELGEAANANGQRQEPLDRSNSVVSTSSASRGLRATPHSADCKISDFGGETPMSRTRESSAARTANIDAESRVKCEDKPYEDPATPTGPPTVTGLG